MNRLLTTIAIALAALCATNTAAAQDTARLPELDRLTNEELIMSVPLGKQADLVRQFQKSEALRLIRGIYAPSTGCNVETYRSQEVIIVTIPAALLFAPNEREVAPGAEKYLDPLRRYLNPQRPDMYRVLLVMHTDNTGSTSYTDSLSLERVEAVYQYLEGQGVDTRYLFPTAAGATDPLQPNDTAERRAANRRLEIYLIPGERMQDAAKKGRIAL